MSDRKQRPVVEKHGRAQEALRKGPHGSQTHTDGDSDASRSAHRPTLRGVDGDDNNNSESYRPNKDGKKIPAEGHPDSSPSFGSKELKNGGKFDAREPRAAKGQPVAIDLASDYSAPTGPSTTRAPLPTPSSYKAKK